MGLRAIGTYSGGKARENLCRGRAIVDPVLSAVTGAAVR